MAASKWKRYSNVIARDLSLSCCSWRAQARGSDSYTHNRVIELPPCHRWSTVHSMRFSKYSWISCIWTIMAFQRGFYSSLFGRSHILESQRQWWRKNDIYFCFRICLRPNQKIQKWSLSISIYSIKINFCTWNIYPKNLIISRTRLKAAFD